MDPEQLRESDIDAIADRVAKQLPTGQYGDKFVFSRRQVMALAASGLSVGALTTLGVDEATAQDAVGAVGTDSDRVDVFANDVTAAGDVSASAVETDSAVVKESISPDSTPYTIYVRSSGDDNNTGLSASEAVGSVSQALRNVLKIGGYDRNNPSVKINVEGGQTFTESQPIIFNNPWVSELHVVSSDDSSYTIERDNGGNVVIVDGGRVKFEHADITGTDTLAERGLYARSNAYVELADCTISGFTDFGVEAERGGKVDLRDTTVTGEGTSSSDFGVNTHDGGWIGVGQNATVEKIDVGVAVAHHSSQNLNGTISNFGTEAVRVASNSYIKVESDTVIENGPDAYAVRRGGSLKLKSGITYNSVTNTEPVVEAGFYEDASGNQSIQADEADVTNESFVKLFRNSDSSTTSAGTYINIFDSTSKDVRDETNTDAEFIPDKSGEYEFVINNIRIGGSTTEGDDIQVRVQDLDNDLSQVRSGIDAPRATSSIGPQFSFVTDLSAGNRYAIEMRNTDNDFTVRSLSFDDAEGTEGIIKKSLIS